jgi:hypothetical protein
MTALQVAKAECSNCDTAGNCTGVGIADDLSCYMFRRPGRCYLAEQPVKRCLYFEQHVVPLAKKRAQAASNHEQQRAGASLTKGVHAYEMAVISVSSVKYAKCKTCNRRVHPPKRFCLNCAHKRVLNSKRQHISQKRSRCRKNGAFGGLITKHL